MAPKSDKPKRDGPSPTTSRTHSRRDSAATSRSADESALARLGSASLSEQLTSIFSLLHELKGDISSVSTTTSYLKTEIAPLAALRRDLNALKVDLNTVKQQQEAVTRGLKELGPIKEGINVLKQDTSRIKTDGTATKVDLNELKQDSKGVKADLARLKEDLNIVKLKQARVAALPATGSGSGSGVPTDSGNGGPSRQAAGGSSSSPTISSTASAPFSRQDVGILRSDINEVRNGIKSLRADVRDIERHIRLVGHDVSALTLAERKAERNGDRNGERNGSPRLSNVNADVNPRSPNRYRFASEPSDAEERYEPDPDRGLGFGTVGRNPNTTSELYSHRPSAGDQEDEDCASSGSRPRDGDEDAEAEAQGRKKRSKREPQGKERVKTEPLDQTSQSPISS